MPKARIVGHAKSSITPLTEVFFRFQCVDGVIGKLRKVASHFASERLPTAALRACQGLRPLEPCMVPAKVFGRKEVHMRRRNECIYERLTDTEYKQLMARVKRSGQTAQSYMIRAAFGKRIYGADTYAEFRGILDHLRDTDYQLNKIGININQIAKVVNTKRDIEKYDELCTELEKIAALRKEAQDTWQLLRLSLEDHLTDHSPDV